MKAQLTRRNFLLGSATAAIAAGLAGCNAGGGGTGGRKAVSEAPAALTGGDNEYYASDYEYSFAGEQKLANDLVALGTQVVQEGVVLLKNEGGALPLSAADGKVVTFGNAGPSYLPGLDGSLTDAGFEFDAASWDFYTNGTQNVNSWQVNENPWSAVQEAGFLSDASGVALVVLGRRDQEGCDAQWHEDHDYLALSAEEKELLNGVAELRRSGTFSKMVVLMSTSNNVSWEDGPWSDAIDALLWFGNITTQGYGSPLPYGVPALVSVLTGEVSPSGRLSDTIYKNNRLNPVMANFGRFDADLSKLSAGKEDEVQAATDAARPSNDMGNHWRHYYIYAEGIYVGYRYPETRYEDMVLGQGNAGDFDYASYVAYPFGAGLGYTTFSFSDLLLEEGDDDFTLTVNVTNTGSVASKTAVCAYVQSPYTDYDQENGIEKASIELKGYEKTSVLEPGASEQVSIKVNKHEVASYDAHGAKTYILDAGDYYFSVAGSAHEALNNVLAAKGKGTADGMTAEGDASLAQVWTNPELDVETFSTSAYTGNKVTNHFAASDPTQNELMKDENSVAWMTRSDWVGTFPTTASKLVYTDAVADLAKPNVYEAGSIDASEAVTHDFGKDSGVLLVDLHGKAYDDADWEKLVGRLTYEEMVEFICNPEAAVTKIGKPKTTAGNGSSGWYGASLSNSGLTAQAFPSKETVSATYNTEIHERIGALTGETMLHSSTVENKNVSLYGWSCNTHRAPYSGRNFEYYSEDPYLGGRSCAEETRGLVDKGGLVYIKHIAGNDQEEYRHGVPSWLDEQTLREIYLRQFEKGIAEGKANGVMTGFHRMGIEWTGENPALLKDFLEGELGYTGTSITDQFEAVYMDGVDGIINGTHVWLGTTSDSEGARVVRDALLEDEYRNDPVVQDRLFEAVHRSLYNYANSLAMNGLSHDYVFAGDVPLAMAVASGTEKTDIAAPTSFYGDKTFVCALKSFMASASVSGTWDYAQDTGLTMEIDGTAIEISNDGGMITFDVPLAGSVAPNAIAQYDLVTAYNDYFGEKLDAGEQPSFKLTFASGSEKATGSDPAELTLRRGETLTLPDNPYTAEHMSFDGWTIAGATYPAGSEYTPAGYGDNAAEGTWSVVVVSQAKTRDGYFHSWKQPAGVALTLFADGSVEADHWKGYICRGTWELEGSGSGVGTLTIKNESGATIATTASGDMVTYEQEGVYYDWHQPDMGYGTGVFITSLEHVIDLGEFADAYNKEFATSYDSIGVSEGTAAFALVESGEPKSFF